MSFPSNPTDGQQTTVNGIMYVYNSTVGAWTVATQAQSISLTVTDIGASGTVSGATGAFTDVNGTTGAFTNVSGNGVALTGINAGNIASGTLPAERLSGTYTITVSGSATTAATVTTAAQPNITSLGSLTGLTVNGTVSAYHINPVTNNSYDLGTSSARWRNIYTNDLQLSNGIGDYTIVEGEEDLFLYNNKNGKTFKFALIEVDPSTVPAKAKQD
jgi:hypothetical protein